MAITYDLKWFEDDYKDLGYVCSFKMLINKNVIIKQLYKHISKNLAETYVDPASKLSGILVAPEYIKVLHAQLQYKAKEVCANDEEYVPVDYTPVKDKWYFIEQDQKLYLIFTYGGKALRR